MEEKIVLCAANSYEQKYYFNPDFQALPEAVQQELQIMCVLFTADVGGILAVVYDEKGELRLEVTSAEDDFLFDEIGSELKIKQLRREKEELFEALQLFYQSFVMEDKEECY